MPSLSFELLSLNPFEFLSVPKSLGLPLLGLQSSLLLLLSLFILHILVALGLHLLPTTFFLLLLALLLFRLFLHCFLLPLARSIFKLTASLLGFIIVALSHLCLDCKSILVSLDPCLFQLLFSLQLLRFLLIHLVDALHCFLLLNCSSFKLALPVLLRLLCFKPSQLGFSLFNEFVSLCHSLSPLSLLLIDFYLAKLFLDLPVEVCLLLAFFILFAH
jgi:hypothetical protein